MSSTEKVDGPEGQRVKDASNPGPETRSRRKDDACTFPQEINESGYPSGTKAKAGGKQ